MAIDNPIDKVREILRGHDDELLGGLIQGAGVFEPIAAVVAVLRSVFDRAGRDERIRAAIRALCCELESLRADLPRDTASALRSEWFKRAVQVMIEEAARSASEERASKIAIALAHGCFPDEENTHRQEDLASYIRDLAHLGRMTFKC